MHRLVVTAVFCFCYVQLREGQGQPGLEVKTPVGTFKGTVLPSFQGHLYKAFFGIPYALPPVGNLRFAKPVEHPATEEVYDATELPPICVQPTGFDLGGPGQEDCLYLNVFTPVDDDFETVPLSKRKYKKVFVYIHGGAFYAGSSREYMAGDLVGRGDVIVVTFNYRLSWLGFLKGPTPELPGNQGMWDQVMALKWVKKNIKYFGGDPSDITLGGNSVGGVSVSALSISPHGKDLFTKGIIMSGSIFTSTSTPGFSDDLLELLTDRVGCQDNNNTVAVVKCLRDLPVEKFSLPIEPPIIRKFTTIDGDLFPAEIGDLLKDNKYLESVNFFKRNYIVSLTNNEGAVEFMGPFSLNIDPDQITAALFSQAFNIPESDGEKAIAWYKQPGHFVFTPAYDLVIDPIINIPTFKVVETFAAYDKENRGHVYLAWLDLSPEYLPPPLVGTCHSLDLIYIFDLPPEDLIRSYYGLEMTKEFSAEDHRTRDLYIDIMASFINSGDPGVPLKKTFNLQWPEFDLQQEGYLNFDYKPLIQHHPLQARRQFWRELYPFWFEDKENASKEEL